MAVEPTRTSTNVESLFGVSRPYPDATELAVQARRRYGNSPGFEDDEAALTGLVRRLGRRGISDAATLIGSLWAADRARGRTLEQLSTRDPLTGLLNVRGFDAQSDRLLSRAQASGEPATLLVLDIDHFRDINNTFGHPTGDLALEEVARYLQQVVRYSDIVARMGGDEFYLLLYGATVQDIRDNLLRKLREEMPAEVGRHISERRQAELGLDAIDLLPTASIGAADTLLSTYLGNKQELINRADAAVYSAKDRNRNRALIVESVDANTGTITYVDTAENYRYDINPRRRVTRSDDEYN